MIDFKCNFFVVSKGKPSSRLKRIWLPNTEMVPVPVRSPFCVPSVRILSNKSRYCFIPFCLLSYKDAFSISILF